MYLTQSVHKGLRERPNALVAVCGTEQMTRAVFAQRVARAAGAFQQLGLRPGDRVAMMASNSLRVLEFFYGIWWAGGVVNPVNTRWSAQEVAYSLDDCASRILIVDDNFAAMVPTLRNLSCAVDTVIYCGVGAVPAGMLGWEALLEGATAVADAGRHDADLAALMYTGGTTGRPKGVMLSHANLYVSMLSNIAALSRTGVECGLLVAPMFHVGGCTLMLILMQRLVPQIILPAFGEAVVLEHVQKYRVNEVFLVPTMLKRLIEFPGLREYDLSTLDLVLYGAAPIEAPVLDRAMAALPHARFAQAYGMTELAPTVAILEPADHLPGVLRTQRLRAAGRPVPIAEIRIADDDDHDVPTGTEGEICVRGPMVMQGYWNKPEETAAALRGGWMRTGDVGRMDADGYLYVVDRLKDMIVTGGENVYSSEVENALARLPGVAMSAVIGVPDPQWGERVHAVLVMRPGETLTIDDVITHCKSLIAGYKCPRSIEFLEALPLSAAGKVQKFELRKSHWTEGTRRIHG